MQCMLPSLAGCSLREEGEQEMSQIIKELPLSSIVLDEAYQPREGLWPEHLDALVNSNPSDWPPVLVKPLPDGRYSMRDGFHRYKAAELLGEMTIKAEIDECADLLTAYERNLKHGMPLTTAERKNYVLLLHEAQPKLTQRELAQRAGVSQSTVARLLDDKADDDAIESGKKKTAPSFSRVMELEAALAQCQAMNQHLLTLWAHQGAEKQ